MIDLEAIRARSVDDHKTVDVLRSMYAAVPDADLLATIHMIADRHELLKAYDALAAERDALRRDAERYRWLRDSAGNDIMEKLMAECSPPRWDELVDAAIDAAMGERP